MHAVRRVDDDEPQSPYVAPEPLPPSNFPWRFLAGLAVVGIAIVLLGVFTYQPSKPGPPDNVLQPGSCVVIQDNGDAAEVNCDSDHDGVGGQPGGRRRSLRRSAGTAP